MSKTKLNLSLSDQTRQVLDELVAESNADSMTEVIRRSLAVYDLLLKERKAGSVLIIRSKDGTEKELVLAS